MSCCLSLSQCVCVVHAHCWCQGGCPCAPGLDASCVLRGRACNCSVVRCSMENINIYRKIYILSLKNRKTDKTIPIR
uniref:Alternative protein CACNA2D2 n=1 Tax=Homo sapiens TaxID=9606 RepID=L0R6E1_HUMAN|nr:alternative protein CACNA2D2 [Homo sapiens]